MYKISFDTFKCLEEINNIRNEIRINRLIIDAFENDDYEEVNFLSNKKSLRWGVL